jgi:hypothetical protein
MIAFPTCQVAWVGRTREVFRSERSRLLWLPTWWRLEIARSDRERKVLGLVAPAHDASWSRFATCRRRPDKSVFSFDLDRRCGISGVNDRRQRSRTIGRSRGTRIAATLLRTAAHEPFAPHGSFERRMRWRRAGPMDCRHLFCRAFVVLARNWDGCRGAVGARTV